MSNAVGRESPAELAELATMPWYGAVSWQVWQPATAAATVVCPAIFSVGLATFAAPIIKPPGFTLLVVWHPEPLQSSEPIGMWFAEVDTIVMLAKVPATAGA